LLSATLAVVAKFLWEDVVCRHKCFSKLVINKGPENKRYVATFTAKYRIKQVQVFAYYLPTNRIIEQEHKLITDALSKLTDSSLGS